MDARIKVALELPRDMVRNGDRRDWYGDLLSQKKVVLENSEVINDVF